MCQSWRSESQRNETDLSGSKRFELRNVCNIASREDVVVSDELERWSDLDASLFVHNIRAKTVRNDRRRGPVAECEEDKVGLRLLVADRERACLVQLAGLDALDVDHHVVVNLDAKTGELRFEVVRDLLFDSSRVAEESGSGVGEDDMLVRVQRLDLACELDTDRSATNDEHRLGRLDLLLEILEAVDDVVDGRVRLGRASGERISRSCCNDAELEGDLGAEALVAVIAVDGNAVLRDARDAGVAQYDVLRLGAEEVVIADDCLVLPALSHARESLRAFGSHDREGRTGATAARRAAIG